MRKALLVIDVQNDFLPRGVVPTQDKSIPTVIHKLLNSQRFGLTVASKDWHPKVRHIRNNAGQAG